MQALTWRAGGVLAATLALGIAVPAVGAPQPPTPEATDPNDPPAGAQPGNGPTVQGPPKLTSLRIARKVQAQRGHARFLVGFRQNKRANVTIRLSSAQSGELVKTVTPEDPEDAGSSFFLVDATDDEGFQLPGGAYRVEIQATDSDNNVSGVLRGSFRLRLTRGRGMLDVYTIPLWTAVARQVNTGAAASQVGEDGPGVLVAAVGPGGAGAKAGVRRGDAIVGLNGRAVGSPGDLSAAMRTLPGERPVVIEILRNGQRRRLTFTTPPDWSAPPDYARSLRVIRKREPRNFAWAVAQVRERIEAGEAPQARKLMQSWTASWRRSAPGHQLAGELDTLRGRHKPALGAYNRARKRDGTVAEAEFGRGVSLAALEKPQDAAAAFGAAERLDAGDPAAPAFRAYVLIRAEDNEGADQVARRAIQLDSRYADAHLPHGIALLGLERRTQGLRSLRTGLLLLDDPSRAQRLIDAHLEPATP